MMSPMGPITAGLEELLVHGVEVFVCSGMFGSGIVFDIFLWILLENSLRIDITSSSHFHAGVDGESCQMGHEHGPRHSVYCDCGC